MNFQNFIMQLPEGQAIWTLKEVQRKLTISLEAAGDLSGKTLNPFLCIFFYATM
jgi:hypothetical protein